MVEEGVSHEEGSSRVSEVRSIFPRRTHGLLHDAGCTHVFGGGGGGGGQQVAGRPRLRVGVEAAVTGGGQV